MHQFAGRDRLRGIVTKDFRALHAPQAFGDSLPGARVLLDITSLEQLDDLRFCVAELRRTRIVAIRILVRDLDGVADHVEHHGERHFRPPALKFINVDGGLLLLVRYREDLELLHQHATDFVRIDEAAFLRLAQTKNLHENIG